MRIPQDERFRREREQFRLCFCCEDCALFDPSAERCVHGYPCWQHREARYRDPEADLLFCKDFELR